MSKKEDLEKDFEEIQFKMERAIDLLRKANELAMKHGLKLKDYNNEIYDLYYDTHDYDPNKSPPDIGVYELGNILHDCGWNVSSMNC